jgi:predicted transcriptional regulator
MKSEDRPNTIMKILEAASAANGATLTKLMNNLQVLGLPDNLKTFLSILENQGLISYQKGDGIYRTTYKGRQFLRTYNHAIKLLSNSEKEIQF